jgi:Fur family transcriptional regulator, iron response regulator
MKRSGKGDCEKRHTPEQIEGLLRKAGLQPTAQRIAICRYVLCRADHPTAEDVKRWADRELPKCSLATVYNTLAALTKAGLLIELRLSHSDSVVYDMNTSKHFHFLDEKTGRLYDVEEDELDLELKLRGGLKAERVEVLIRGSAAPGRRPRA